VFWSTPTADDTETLLPGTPLIPMCRVYNVWCDTFTFYNNNILYMCVHLWNLVIIIVLIIINDKFQEEFIGHIE